MNKYLLLLVVFFISCISCSSDEDSQTTGSIYGVITIKETAEPMRATGVELHKSEFDGGGLLLKSVTYDDGHYEFENLNPGNYTLRVAASGYSNVEYAVIVEQGRTARADMQLEKINTTLTVQTLEPVENGEEFTFKGAYTVRYGGWSPTECGFYYSTNTNPEIGGVQIKGTTATTFSANTKGLKKGVYYVRAYAKNHLGTEYGPIRRFEVHKQPIVTTFAATNITSEHATLNGMIEYEGEPSYTERGFVYSKYFQNPTIEDLSSSSIRIPVSGRSKEFSANIAGLTSKTTYYARTYAIHQSGTVYGNTIQFSNMDYFILQEAGIMVQKNDLSSGSNWSKASELCTSSKVGGYTDWRLPTRGESMAIQKALQQNSHLNIDISYFYWTADIYDTYSCYYMDYYNNKINHGYRSRSYRVRAVRSL